VSEPKPIPLRPSGALSHLRPASRRWAEYVRSNWELDQHHDFLLLLAAGALDRGAQARRVLEKSGLTVEDRFGQVQARPEVRVERDAAQLFARLLKELDLDQPQALSPMSLGRRRGGGRR
jgi:hypothetical protein